VMEEIALLPLLTESWAFLDNFRTSGDGFQALEDVVLVGGPWMADEA